MKKIGLYDLLPLIVRDKDAEASDGPGGPILKRIVDCIQEQADNTETLIAGFRSLIDIDAAEPLVLALLAKSLGGNPPVNLQDFNLREYTKELVNSYKIKGLILSWFRQMKFRQLGNFTPVELYKSQIYESLNYSATKNEDYSIRSSKVTFQAPPGFGAILESLPVPWRDRLAGLDWIGVLGFLQWRQLLLSGQLDELLDSVSDELLIGQWCHNHANLVDRQVSYQAALNLIKDLDDVVPIHVLPPTPACFTVFADKVKETCDGNDKSLLILNHTDCKSQCQAICENTIQTVCSKSCEPSCVTSCQKHPCQLGCQTVCVISCEKIMEAGCDAACQVDCEGLCQIKCQLTCEGGNCEIRCMVANCQFSCESTYTLDVDILETKITCVGVCQTKCQEKCQYCESSCASSCEESCQFDCEKKCQNSCESFCQEGCEQKSEDRCQYYCQDKCESRCTSTCQSGCQKRCEGSCQDAREMCRGGCQGICQTQKQSICKDTCEFVCQTQEQNAECKPRGGTCASATECPVPASPPTASGGDYGYGEPMAPPVDCTHIRESGCATTVETCKTSLETQLKKYKDLGPCSFLMELPHSKPIPESQPHIKTTIQLIGYKVNRILVVLHGKDYEDKPVAYWVITDESGKATVNAPLYELTVQPVWFGYPALKFDPPSVKINFGVAPTPNIGFIVSAVQGGTRGPCVGLSPDWCGAKCDNEVSEPVTAQGYRREPHNSWEKATLQEAYKFLAEANINTDVFMNSEFSAFWNHGQIVFAAPQEDLGVMAFLNLYDADYRYVEDGGKLIAWSPLIPPLRIPAGGVLKIPHRSQIFFKAIKPKRRNFLGDHISDFKSVPVQVLLPDVCEDTCELTCQVSCTTHCEIAKRDHCKTGCTSWKTTGCQTNCEATKRDSPTTNPPVCAVGSCQTGVTLPKTDKKVLMSSRRIWTWDKRPAYINLEDLPDECYEKDWTGRRGKLLTSKGHWVIKTFGYPFGGWDEQRGALYINGSTLPWGKFQSHRIGIIGTWSDIFGIPEDATVKQFRILSFIYCVEVVVDGPPLVLQEDFHNLSSTLLRGSSSGERFRYVYYIPDKPTPFGDWKNLGKKPFLDVHRLCSNNDKDWPQEFYIMLNTYAEQVPTNSRITFYLKQVAFEILYETRKTQGCSDRCQMGCESPCELGCATICQYYCETNKTEYARRPDADKDCITKCEVYCMNLSQPRYWDNRITGQSLLKYYNQPSTCNLPVQAVLSSCINTCAVTCTAEKCQASCQFACQSIEQSVKSNNENNVCYYSCQTSCQRFCQIGIEISTNIVSSFTIL